MCMHAFAFVLRYVHGARAQKSSSTFLTLAQAGGSDRPPPLRFYRDSFRTGWRIGMRFGIGYGATFAHILVKKLTRSGQGTELCL